MTIGKKIVSVFLSFLMLFSVCVEAFAGTSMETALNKVNLYVKEESKGQLLTWKGVIDARNFAPDVIVYKAEDGREYPAFCANPNKGGVENFAAKNYDVDVDRLDKDPHVWGAITNGYPYKTPAELGVKNAYEAYYITKMAVWAIVHDNYSNLNDWKANGSQNNHVEKAMKALVAKGRANTAVYPTWLAVNPKSTTVSVDEKDSNYISQTYTLKSNVDIKSYRVVIDGNVPAGAKVTDMSNKEKTEFSGSELTFKVLIPKDSPKGEFRVLVKGKLENKSVLFGVAHDEKKQNYYVSPLPSYNGDSWVQLAYAPEGGDVPDTPETPTTDVQILKVKKGTKEGLAGAVFKVEIDGKTIGHYVTDKNGEIKIEKVTGTLSVTEEVPPKGYVLDENNHKDVEIRNNDEPTVITFANEEQAQLEVVKIDADTGDKLEGAVIRVAYDGGNDFWDLHTNASGKASLSNLKSGTYSVKEISAPAGYLLNDTVQTVKLEAGKTATVTLKNKAKPGILIKKYDEDTGMPLPDAEFSVAKKGGSIVYEGMTDKSGQIKVENLSEDWYTITEIAAPKGYLIADKSKDVYLEGGKCVVVKFDNRLRPSLQLMKLDAKTNEPLAGAKFKVTKTEDKTVSEYVTDRTGTVVIRDLDEAVYTVEEIQAPDGYTISTDNHKDIALEWGKTKTLIFTDTKKPTLIITKTNALTNQGVPDTVFKIQREKADGGVVTLGTYKTDANGEFITDSNGEILIPNVKPDSYVVTEIQAPTGYEISEEAKTIQVGTDGGTYQLRFADRALNGLVISKIDEESREPIKNVTFEVSKMNGERIGTYRTDSDGKIALSNLESGWYTVIETKAAKGYALDKEPKHIEVKNGKQVLLTVTNRQTSSMLIHKIDSVTGEGIYGVTFLVSDARHNPIGQYTSDQNGYVYIDRELKDGKYYVQEIQPAEGYLIDHTEKTFYVEYGETSHITWKNTPQMGQIQITKKSADDNPISGLAAGTLLPDAVFEIYSRAGNLVDTVKTDKNGRAVSKTLPLGRYVIRETKAPNYYIAEKAEINAEIAFSGQIVRLEVLNRSCYTNVSVTKRGYNQIVPGQEVRYTFTNIKNNSTVPLNSFYWRDTLPVNAARLEKIITGTWNQRLSYKIVYKTNLNGTYRTLADNLSTAENRVIFASPAALGLAANEYVTEVMFVFGTVKSGFAQVETPYIYCRALSNLPHEYRFANKTDVGGLWNGQWIMGNDSFVTVVYGKKTAKVLPRTGY